MRFEKVSYGAFRKAMLENGFTEEAVSVAYDNIKLPERKTEGSAGYDFATPIKFVLHPHQSIIIPTGIKCYFEPEERMEYHLQLFVRSSTGIKQDIVLSNGTGVIDADFYNSDEKEGCMLMAFYNRGDHYRHFEAGDRMMQGVFIRHGLAEEDNVTAIRQGGVGSTNA